MSRAPRVILKQFGLVEVTNRTIHSRLLLRPSPQLNAIIVGALARAQKKYGVLVHAFVFMSNHYHLLISPCDAQQMAKFIGYFQSKVAKEIGRLYGWKDKVWSRRFHHIPVASDEASQLARLRYLLENSCKENLVYSPLEWPGASSAQALAGGVMTIEGSWPDRTAEWWARRSGKPIDVASFLQSETLHLTQLPCWREHSEEKYLQYIQQIVEQIEQETRLRHAQIGTKPLGMRRIRAQHPHSKPKSTKRSPKPSVHARTRQVRTEFGVAMRTFVLAYRSAARSLLEQGIWDLFPSGCFPPGLPFVPT